MAPPQLPRSSSRRAQGGRYRSPAATHPRARIAIEEQFSDGSERAVVRWRYDWREGHVRGVDIVRIRDGRLAESPAYVKG